VTSLEGGEWARQAGSEVVVLVHDEAHSNPCYLSYAERATACSEASGRGDTPWRPVLQRQAPVPLLGYH
jgi:hypothetical protein